MDVNYQQLLETAITNAGFQVTFIDVESEENKTNEQNNLEDLDGQIYRYSYTVNEKSNLIMIPVKLNSSALFVYVPQKSDCPAFNQLSSYTPVGVFGIRYFDKLYELSQVGFIEQDTITRATESLMKTPFSFTVFPDDIMPSLMQFTGAKLKRCYQQPIFVMTAYSYLHKKHANKIDAISTELNALLLSR